MPNPTLRLSVTASSGLSQQAAGRVTFCGLDQIPVPCRANLRDGLLQIERPMPESGRLQVPFPVPGRGELILSTGTLMHRERPYHLEVELARGKVNQVRNQLAEWTILGLQVPPLVASAVEKMIREFALAATSIRSDTPFAVEQSKRAIVSAVEAADLIADTYVEQALALRHRMSPQLPTWLAAPLPAKPLPAPTAEMIQTAFNTFGVALTWRNVEPREGSYEWSTFDAQVEWCHAQGAPVIGGPLIWIDPAGMPDWTKNAIGNFEDLTAFASDYVSTVVQRYHGRFAMWEVMARINSTTSFRMTEDQRLQLAIRMVEVARRVDPDTPCILRFDQPWGEYLRNDKDFELTPLHFADALVRSGLQLGGVGLEFNVGYQPHGTSWRDRLDFSRLLDMWSYLGLPLHVTLTAPSRQAPDPRANQQIQSVPSSTPWTNDAQAQWAQQMTPLLLSKAFVHSVTWGHLSDADPHEFPHSGVIDEFGRAKPTLTALSHIRRLHLH